MKEILKNKKKMIIIILIVLVIVLLGIVVIRNKIDKAKKEKIELGNSIYEKAHNLYFYGGDIVYETDDNNTRKYIEVDKKKYYEIKNYKEVFNNLLAQKQLPKTSNFLGIKVIEDKYYMKDYGRGLSGYYGTGLKIKKMSKNRIEYKALSKFCEIDSRVNYGDGCSNEKYYYVEKPFVLIKEDGIWKVEEYTSVFEFKDKEFK